MRAKDAKVGMRVLVHPTVWETSVFDINPKHFQEGIIKRIATSGNSAAVEFDRELPGHTSTCHSSTKDGHGKYIAWENLKPVKEESPSWANGLGVGDTVYLKKALDSTVPFRIVCFSEKAETFEVTCGSGAVTMWTNMGNIISEDDKPKKREPKKKWFEGKVVVVEDDRYTANVNKGEVCKVIQIGIDKADDKILQVKVKNSRGYTEWLCVTRLADTVLPFREESSIDPAWKQASKMYFNEYIKGNKSITTIGAPLGVGKSDMVTAMHLEAHRKQMLALYGLPRTMLVDKQAAGRIIGYQEAEKKKKVLRAVVARRRR